MEKKKAIVAKHVRRFYDITYAQMHTHCYELLESERFDKSDQKHIDLMTQLNYKLTNKTDLCVYLGERAATNMKIKDTEIAEHFSDPQSMILAADNATCDHINSFMASFQEGHN